MAIAPESTPSRSAICGRMLVAQLAIEGILLLTTDPIIAWYPGPVRKV